MLHGVLFETHFIFPHSMILKFMSLKLLDRIRFDEIFDTRVHSVMIRHNPSTIFRSAYSAQL